MSRWFRHYAGMMRDEKLVAVAIRSKQPVHLVVWVWGAILESAAEVDDGGRYDFDAGEAARFLAADEGNLRNVESQLGRVGYVAQGRVVWELFKCGEDGGRPSADVWRRLRSFVFGRDNYTCQYCGDRGRKLECDHVIPVARGGSHKIDNLVTACFACNRSKRDKLIEEWVR